MRLLVLQDQKNSREVYKVNKQDYKIKPRNVFSRFYFMFYIRLESGFRQNEVFQEPQLQYAPQNYETV